MAEGTPVDIRTTLARTVAQTRHRQILETHLAGPRRVRIKIAACSTRRAPRDPRFLGQVYNKSGADRGLWLARRARRLSLAGNLRTASDGDPGVDGATEAEIKYMLRLADLPESGQTWLFDGARASASIGEVTSATCTC